MQEVIRGIGRSELYAKNEFERAVLDIKEVNIWTERIIGQLMSYIDQKDTDFSLIPFLCGILEPNQRKSMGNTQLKAIETAAENLKGANYTLYYGPHHWKSYPLFEYIHFDNGLIEGKFNQALRPFLLGVLAPNFAIRNLPEFRRLRKVHSQIMYKLCNSWKDRESFEIPIEDLKVIFRCWTQKSYSEYGEFNRCVLKPAIREINKISTIMPVISCTVSEYALPDRRKNPKAKHGEAIKVRFTLTPRQARVVETEEQKPAETTEQLQQHDFTFDSKIPQKDIDHEMVEMVKRDMAKERQQEDALTPQERYAARVGAYYKEKYNFSDEFWEQLVREEGLTFTMPLPEDLMSEDDINEGNEGGVSAEYDDLTEEEEEQARQEMEEAMLNDPVYGADYKEAVEMAKMGKVEDDMFLEEEGQMIEGYYRANKALQKKKINKND